MTPTSNVELTEDQLDAIAWEFLASEFTGPSYANWPIDRRVEAYLEHNGLVDRVNAGHAYDLLLDRVMANVGPALRNGLLASPRS